MLRLRALVSLFVLVAVTTPAAAQSRDALVQRLDSIANAPVVEQRVVGIGVAVVKGSDTLLLKGYGKADVEWNVPMAADAMFEIGSVTKQFTAAALLQLRDEGKLSLDDEITKYLPDFPTRGHKVTLRRLLDHTSGIKGLTEMPEFGPLHVTNFPRDSAYVVIKKYPFEFAPGDAMIYNNSAFWLLGLVIEKASGMTYENYVEQKIFAPLGMTRSMYCNSSEVVERRAHGYMVQARNIRRAPSNVHTWPFSAGSLCSTAGDMVTWLKALHGGKVLSARSYAEMTTPSTLNDGTPLRYGMGIGVATNARGVKVIGHGGGIAGFVTEVSWYPASDLAVVVLMNSNGPIDPGALAAELAAEVVPGTRPVMQAFTGDAAPLAGRYAGPSRGREMVAVVAQGPQGVTISVNGSPARPVMWVDGWTFRTGNVILTFRRAGNSGNASELRYDTGGGHYVLKRQ